MFTYEKNLVKGNFMKKSALKIQKILNNSGFKTFAVGGCVRDMLLGKEPKDIDFATLAKPSEMINIFKEQGIKTLPTGIDFGTVTVCLENKQFEVTTLRKDKVCDGRWAEVEYGTSFEEDAKRRDFTINALYMDLETGEIIDYVGGKKDLEGKILKFVGDPVKRIKEDYLRILRLFRFKAVLGFSIEESSEKESLKYLFEVRQKVSQERITSELLKMIIGGHLESLPSEILSTIIRFNVIPIYPHFVTVGYLVGCKQKCPRHMYDVYTHTIKGVVWLSQFKDPILSLTFLLHDIAKPFCKSEDNGRNHFYDHDKIGANWAEQIGEALRLTNEQVHRIKFLIEHHTRLDVNMTEKAIRRFIFLCRESGIDIMDQLRILEADFMGMRPEFLNHALTTKEQVLSVLNKIDNFKEQVKIDSPLDGKEIMDLLGLPPGKLLGEIKDYLKQKVVDGELVQGDKETAKNLVKIYENKR